jgi:hypothetical protein
MIIIGSGMAGLIAGAVLRNACEKIIEAQSSLPANHSAVLRFKSSIVGDTTNIPFKKVKAIKAVLPWKNPIADAMAYSLKSNAGYQLRSIVTADGSTVERYVAPPNFTEQLAAAASREIVFNQRIDKEFFHTQYPDQVKSVISTLPMPVLMDLLDYDGPRPEFKSIPGINVMARIKNCDMYCSLYIPDPAIGPYRVSINGDMMIAEVALVDERLRETMRYGSLTPNAIIQEQINTWREQAFAALGIEWPSQETYDHSFARQQFQKIVPVDERERQRFIIWASDVHNCFSLGRFATWRPSLLLDDIIHDTRVISRLIAHGNYEYKKSIGAN